VCQGLQCHTHPSSVQSPAEIARLTTIHFSTQNLLRSSSKLPHGQIHQGSILHLVGQSKRHPDNRPRISQQSHCGISIAYTGQIQYSSISATLQCYRITTPIFDSKTSLVASVSRAPMPHPPKFSPKPCRNSKAYNNPFFNSKPLKILFQTAPWSDPPRINPSPCRPVQAASRQQTTYFPPIKFRYFHSIYWLNSIQ
jgi:hypothetical protein